MLDPSAASVMTKILTGIASTLGAKYAQKGLTALAEKQKTWREDDYYKAAKTYTDELTHLYGHIRVIGMEKPLPLEGVYTDVNILTKLTSSYRLSEKLAEDIFLGRAGYGEIAEKDRGKDGLEVLRNHDKLFLLGKPGAGKTTFLKHSLHKAIEGKLFPKQEVIPIFIPLKVWSESSKSVFDFIVQQFDICHFPDSQAFIETILLEGHAIVLCDGLDEVMRETRSTCITELNKFSNKYHKCPFVISCRIAATDYNFEKFTYVEMADFNPEQVKTFVEQWFKARDDVTKSVKFFEEFERSNSRGLRELAKTPLLLGMLCLAFEDNLAFPTRQKQIYEDAINALLRKWYAVMGVKHEDIYKNLDHDRKRQMFARIAADSFEKGKYIFPRESLQADLVSYLRMIPPQNPRCSIDGEGVLKAIECQHGVLVERAKDFYTFSHLSIQEYFTAEYIVQNEARGSMHSLIENHFHDERWREVFLRTAETLADADRFFEIFITTFEDFVQSNPRLLMLSEYVETFVMSNPSFSPLVNRIEIVFWILDNAIWLTRIRDTANSLNIARTLTIAVVTSVSMNQNHNRALVFAVSRARDFDHARALARARALSHDFVLSRNLALDRALALVRDFAMTRAFDLALALDRAFALDSLKEAIVLSEELGLSELHRELVAFRIPGQKAANTYWQAFADSLERIFRKHRPVDQYEFTIEEINTLSDYLYGVKLLLDCLAVAYVTDREGIKERLLRVPA